MIVKCARCGATYDFPVKTLPADGMRVKCGSCKHVMLIRLKGKGRRPGRALRQSKVRDITTLPPPVVAAGMADRRSLSQLQETPRRAEKPANEGPSVIIDMGQLNDEVAEARAQTAPAAAPEPEATELVAAPPVAAFAPLSTGPQSRPETIDRGRPSSFDLQLEDVEIIPIQPPTLWRLWGGLALIAVVGFAAYVGWRNNWSPAMFEDPKLAFDVAMGTRERPKPPAPKPALIVKAEAPRGRLEISAPEMELIWSAPTKRAAIIRGTVRNGTNRIQKAIGVEVAVLDTQNALPLKIRVVACCETFDKSAARTMLKTPDHPHFATALNQASSVSLAPGESRSFAAIVDGLDGGMNPKRFAPQAKIKFSEPE